MLTRLRFKLLSLVSPQAAARRGADLFCDPRESAPHGNPASTKACDAHVSLLRVDGHALATYVWGDPETQPYVLLAHGWSSQTLDYLAWVRALRAAGYAVVAFDQPGHGCSSGGGATLPDFVCNLLAVGWRHGRAAAVLGHAWGGAACALALSHGLQADRAILVAAHADPDEAVDRFANRMGIGGVARRRMVALLEQRSGVAFDDLQAHRIAPTLGHPALVVHDVEDEEVPWAEGERYARLWPRARLLTTNGLGHRRICCDPTVIAACLRFLAGETVGERVVSSPNLPYGVA